MTLLIAQIQSPDQPDFSNWLELINNSSRNATRSRGSSPSLLEKDCLDKNVSVILLKLAPKIQTL